MPHHGVARPYQSVCMPREGCRVERLRRTHHPDNGGALYERLVGREEARREGIVVSIEIVQSDGFRLLSLFIDGNDRGTGIREVADECKKHEDEYPFNALSDHISKVKPFHSFLP